MYATKCVEGYLACPTCNGKGNITEITDCPTCGNGTITCPTCNGTGEYCETCNGSNKITCGGNLTVGSTTKYQSFTCNFCGSYKILQTKTTVTCSKCSTTMYTCSSCASSLGTCTNQTDCTSCLAGEAIPQCPTCNGEKVVDCSECEGGFIIPTCVHGNTETHWYCEHFTDINLTEHSYCDHNMSGAMHCSGTIETSVPVVTATLNTKTTNSFTVDVDASDENGGYLTYNLYVNENATPTVTKTVAQDGSTVQLKATGLDEYTTYTYYVSVENSTASAQTSIKSVRTKCSGKTYTCTRTYCAGSTSSTPCTNCTNGTLVCNDCKNGCTICGGDGKVTCSSEYFDFEEWIWVEQTATCFSCEESVDYYWLRTYECSVCGKTTRDSPVYAYCENCVSSVASSGKKMYLGHQSTCSVCNGSGRDQNCSVCGGEVEYSCPICSGGTIYVSCSHDYYSKHYYCSHSTTDSLGSSHYYCDHNYNGVEHE